MNELIHAIDTIPFGEMIVRAECADERAVREILRKEHRDRWDLAVLLSPAADRLLEEVARAAADLTAQRFGRTIRLYAPLYLSNECVNVCTYCGFRRDNDVARSTLNAEQIRSEARYLSAQGFRNILLVSGEHPKWVNRDYLSEAVRITREFVPQVAIEVQPLTTSGYEATVEAGADGVVVYQEVYDREHYASYHTHGPKKDYDDRLLAASRAATAGVRRLGIGTLLGLAPWREEILALGTHAAHLYRRFGQTEISFSFPRIREAAGAIEPRYQVSDRQLLQMMCALRLVFPDAGIVLSTREAPALRDGLSRIAVTMMSAGSRTEPGGYEHPDESEKQFEIEDHRTPAEVGAMLSAQGIDPVWKDWEEALHG